MNNSGQETNVKLIPDWKSLETNVPAVLFDAYAEQGETAPSGPAALQVGVTGDGSERFPIRACNFRALAAR